MSVMLHIENCKYLLLVSLACVFYTSLEAEVSHYSQRDSIENLADTTGIGKKIDSTLQVAFRLRKVNFDSAMEVCESVYPYVVRDAKRHRLSVYYAIKGAIMQINGRALTAVPWLNKARAIANELGRDLLQRQITNQLLITHIHLGQYERALKYGMELKSMSEEVGDTVHSAIALGNLGLLYYKMLDSKTALQYYYKFLSVNENRLPLVQAYTNMGLCHNQLGNYDSAFYYYEKSKTAVDAASGLSNLLGYHHSMANTLITIKKFGDAEQHLLISINIAKNLGEDRLLADIYSLIGIVSREKGRLDDAIKWQLQSENLCIKNGLASGLGVVYRELVEIYRLKHDFRRAVVFQSKYLENWRDVYGEDVMVAVSLLEGEFNERGNTDRLVANEKLVSLKRNLWQTRNAIMMSGFVVLGLLIVFVVVLIHLSRRQRKINEMIETEVRQRTDFLETDLESAMKARNLTNQSMQNAFGFIVARLAMVKGCIQLTKMSGNLASSVMGSKPIEEMERRLDALRLQIQMKNGTPSA